MSLNDQIRLPLCVVGRGKRLHTLPINFRVSQGLPEVTAALFNVRRHDEHIQKGSKPVWVIVVGGSPSALYAYRCNSADYRY